MPHIGLHLLRNKLIQTSTNATLMASAAAPDSGFAFVNNSQGALSALSEFLAAISAALDHIDLSGNIGFKRMLEGTN